jgi:hypothetical protein
MTDTRKYRDFVRGTMRAEDRQWLPVDVIPGIGPGAAEHLGEKNNFTHAYQVLGQFLAMDLDEELFKAWLRDLYPKFKPTDLDAAFVSMNDWVRGNI